MTDPELAAIVDILEGSVQTDASWLEIAGVIRGTLSDLWDDREQVGWWDPKTEQGYELKRTDYVHSGDPGPEPEDRGWVATYRLVERDPDRGLA